MAWDLFNQSVLRYEKNPLITVLSPATQSKASALMFIKYSGIMGTSNEIIVYSQAAVNQKERLHFLLLLVNNRKTHLDSKAKVYHDHGH